MPSGMGLTSMPAECIGRLALRWLKYRAVSAVVLQPLFLRKVAGLLRQYPALASLVGAVATRDEVAGVFDRQALFSSTAHRPNLAAGDFVIGMESGSAHATQRRAVEARLPTSASFRTRAAQESRVRVCALLVEGEVRRLDVVADYMGPIVWRCLRDCFGEALPMLAGNDPLFAHLRHVGAHLIVGSVATDEVQVRARQAAGALDAWVRARLPQIREAWAPGGAVGPDDDEIARDAMGLLWVGHPASVQALALVLLDLLPRPEWAQLSGQARKLHSTEQDVWEDVRLRDTVRDHVLESLRFRPPFPILRRDVVRDGHLAARPPRRVQGGTQMTLMGLGAMFDAQAHLQGAQVERYCPGRNWVHKGDKTLMFGLGERQCIARDHVVEMLTSALIGLLLLPELRFADPWWARYRVDGPAIDRLRLAFTC